jgi:hypothetical protein
MGAVIFCGGLVMKTRFLGVLALVLLAGPLVAKGDPLRVTIDGTEYDIDTCANVFDKCFTPPYESQMPWWGDAALAMQFAAAFTGAGGNWAIPFALSETTQLWEEQERRGIEFITYARGGEAIGRFGSGYGDNVSFTWVNKEDSGNTRWIGPRRRFAGPWPVATPAL